MFKRILALGFAALLLLGAVSGCAKSPADLKADVTLEKLASEIMASDENYGMLYPLEDEYYTAGYGGSTDGMEEHVFYEGMTISSTRIYIAKAKTADDAKQIEKDFSAARQAVEDTFSTYLPAPYEMAKQGRVVIKGLYVMMIIGPNVDKAVEIFEGHIS